MSFVLHKSIKLQIKQNSLETIRISVFGKLMGWTDGETEIDSENINEAIEHQWKNGGVNSMMSFMKGIVGPCVIEISVENDIYFFASCASGGFYWIKEKSIKTGDYSYLVSNDEGKFLRQAVQMGKSISEGALMNAIVSHQALIRPLFSGLVNETMRCPPGFFVKFSTFETKINTYLIDTNNKNRKQQDEIIKKKMESVSNIYKNFSKLNESKIKLCFSGGVDSTVLLLVYKSGLDNSSMGYYAKRDKMNEFKIAKEIAKRLDCNIDFIESHKNFSHIDVRKRASVGLSMLNGIPYMRQSFQFSPYKLEDKKNFIFLTGQNSDTLFHIDTKAPSSFTTGIIRLIKMAQGLGARLRTTMFYYNLLNLIKSDTKEGIPPGVKYTYYTLNEHGGKDKVLSKNINKILNDYKYQNYILPLEKWLKTEFYPSLNNKGLNKSEKLNHAARFARWLRTIGNFHQGFFNFSSYDKTLICVPYSEGPMASELLTYKLGIIDALTPKKFLHNYIKNKLGKSYSKIRQEILGGKIIHFPWELIYLTSKLFTKLIQKLFLNKKKIILAKSRSIKRNDIENLRNVLIDGGSDIKRVLLDYVNDKECKLYLNYLYDCLDHKIDTTEIKNISGMHLCRLVNLQIMLSAKEDNV